MDTFSSFASTPVSSTTQDGNVPSVGIPNVTHGAIVVGIIVAVAIILLIVGVISLKASGEVVI